ncbi:glycine-tRNA ligase 2 chloroplastic/mitochondrial-like, partial [Trifolium pratense]
EKLGTMLDKITRVENMVTKLSCLLDINEDTQQTIREAASLAISDVAISVFMTLAVVTAVALFEITLPRFSGDRVPKSDAGIVLAIADRFLRSYELVKAKRP